MGIPTETWKLNLAVLILIAVYAVDYLVFVYAFKSLSETVKNEVLRYLIADEASVVFLWIFSIFVDNASVIDPAWTLQPLALVSLWFRDENQQGISVPVAILFCVLSLWSFRLTVNWYANAKTWHYEDFRFVNTRKMVNNKILFHLISFVGFMTIPSVLIFFACLPLYYVSYWQAVSLRKVVGVFLSFVAVLHQLAADEQMRVFRSLNKDKKKSMNKGLWAYSRHPNYFSEICFWWGIYIACSEYAPIWTFVGPLLMTFLFNFVTIGMMEKHLLSTREDYSLYKKTTSRLVPWLPNSEEEQKDS